MHRSLQFCLALCLTLVGCAEPEILDPRDGTVPVGVDLSGNWLMREIPPEERRRLADAINKTDGVDNSRANRRRGGRGSVDGGLVYVFLETGSALKVTQTPHGLFISFDRSVVEEFRFGENRLISIGQVEAQRVSGWEGDELVVETLGENGMKLTERFRLADGGNTMERQITFRSKKLEEETIIQEFDRVD